MTMRRKSIRLAAVLAYAVLAFALLAVGGCLKVSGEDYRGGLSSGSGDTDYDTGDADLGPYCDDAVQCFCDSATDADDFASCYDAIASMSESECDSLMEDYGC
jgi:hypothetical protein